MIRKKQRDRNNTIPRSGVTAAFFCPEAASSSSCSSHLLQASTIRTSPTVGRNRWLRWTPKIIKKEKLLLCQKLRTSGETCEPSA